MATQPFVFAHKGGPEKKESESRWISRLEELAAQKAGENRRLDQERRVEEQVRVAKALGRENEAAAKAEAERQRLEKAARENVAVRQQQALHTLVGRWLVMDGHFSDAQATRFCAGLEELGLSTIQALKVQEETEQQQLALELKMNRSGFRYICTTNACWFARWPHHDHECV